MSEIAPAPSVIESTEPRDNRNPKNFPRRVGGIVFATAAHLPADADERAGLVADALAAVGGGDDPSATDGDLVVRGWYDVAGLRSDADLMVWWHGPTVESVQRAYQHMRASGLGAHLEPVWSTVALQRAG